MRVPVTWLSAYCDPGMPLGDLAQRLAMTGTEVERVARHGAPAIENFVIGRVVSASAHPDADRLKVCQVDLGDGEPSTIVCGAPNVAAGQTVAVARPGAIMPGGDKLKKAKLRGVESNGMILAQDELEIGGDHTGVMVLSEGLPDANGALVPGAPLSAVLLPGDDVLELEITPNRPDCLGIYGVAREVHAITGNPLASLPVGPAPEGDEGYAIEVIDRQLCPRFTARIFRDVTIGPSPLWFQQRLAAAGQRPINNVVDITNYAMLLTGQPMHAFDLDKIRGDRLVIRRAIDGEQVTTLDGVERECDGEMMLVCDGEGPSAIAGIMGGAVSEVSDQTVNVLLEIATWNGPNIHHTSQKLGLRSEASGRFEKGLSPRLPLEVQEIASALMVDLCGARLVSSTIDVAAEIAEPKPILLRAARVEGLLGSPIDPERCAEILERLAFTVTRDGADLIVTPPHIRSADVTREADLIEEVARIDGIDRLPATMPAARAAIGRLTNSQKLKRRCEDYCADLGFHEAISWSFTSHATLAALAPGRDRLKGKLLELANPLSDEMAVMRPLVLPGLLDAARHNFARGASYVRFFEAGAIYGGTPQSPREQMVLALLIAGDSSGGRGEANFFEGKRLAAGDFAEMQGYVQNLGKLAHTSCVGRPLPEENYPFLTPGRAAELFSGENRVGYVGEIHPLVFKEFDLPAAVAAEIDLTALGSRKPDSVHFEPISSFPPAREDIAVVVPRALPAAEVVETVCGAAGKLLTDATIFDLYEGDQIGKGKKSLAIRLTYSAHDRTLTDDEIAQLRARIVAALNSIGGALRG